MGLRDTALQAIQQRRQRDIDYQIRTLREHMGRDLDEFEERFGVRPEGNVEVEDGVAYLVVRTDGLLIRKRMGHWQLQDKCPRCGQTVWSTPFNTLEELGELIEGFRPEWGHMCDDTDAPSIGDRVKTVLLEFLEID